MEKTALEDTFGEKFREIKVINIKGMTGHTLGASLEEALSAKALQYQKIPPIVNYKEPDPDLEGLNLSEGGTYQFEYVLRTVSAMGGNGNYHLLQRLANGDERITDKKLYREWVDSISSKDADLKHYGRLLVADSEEINDISIDSTAASVETPILRNIPEKVSAEGVIDKVLEIYSDITKYPKDMLELSMEIEADLGIDTVKQATIFSILADRFELNISEGEGLSNYPTIGHIVQLILEKTGSEKFVEKPQVHNEIIGAQKEFLTSDYENEVLKLVSDITQYPVDLLEKEMDMEADLGIDTVKQATIISMIKEKYQIEDEKSENISGYHTIGSLIELAGQNGINSVDNAVGEYKELSFQDVVETTYSQEKLIKDNEEINHGGQEKLEDVNYSNEVIELISQITKYPVEMLEEDMELEADLGIDTIKQATIISELGERFAPDTAANLKLSELRTIKSLIDAVESKAAADTQRNSNIDADTTGDYEDDNFEMELCVQSPAIVEEKITTKDFILKGKNIIIIGDDPDKVKTIKEHFRKISCDVCEVVFEKNQNPDELNILINALKDKIIGAEVILDCSHLGSSYDFFKVGYEEEKEILYLNSVCRFLFYKKLKDLKTDPGYRILCAVSMDGCFGFAKQQNSIIDPYYGALCGFYKSLRKEFEKSKVKIIDLGTSEAFETKDFLFTRLEEELEEGFKSYEIGYVNGKRVTLKLDNVERSELMPIESYDSSHFVISGGGNGITAEIALGISERFKAKFTILGRTELPVNIEELSKLDEKSLEQIRIDMYDRYKAEGNKATPAELQMEYSKITKAISVYKLLQEIKENGSDVQYISCDVTDYQGLKSALAQTTAAYGSVNVIIHGAGIEKSRLIEQKTKEDFEEVFEVKAKGLCNLYRLADNKALKVLIGFSSISGRFGNEAQLDYCSANNFISSFMSMIKSCNKDLRAVSISWSGWKDIGIAWRNEFVKENSEEMGLHLIEPERGTNEFLNILTSNINMVELVISKGLGRFTGDEKWQGIKNAAPLIDWVSKRDGDINKVYKVLSVKADPIINNHRLGKTPLMPAVGFMEIGAQTHSLIYGKKEQYCFKNLKLLYPLKLFNDKPQEVVMTLNKAASGDIIDVIFYNYFMPKAGKGKLIKLNSMTISGDVSGYEYLSDIKNIETDDMIETSLVDSFMRTSKKLNNAINLGPLFMDEKSAKINTCKCNTQGAILSIAMSEEQITNKRYDLNNLLINPAFADSLMQACGVHASMDKDSIYLPWEIGEFGVVNVPRKPGIFKVYAKMIKDGEREKFYDVILYNDNGESCYYAKNVIVKYIAQ
jgi:NAD(P)-dependent dehydrogenase (short-subunit alcohol dehydrogenase family)/acyl carrier protein